MSVYKRGNSWYINIRLGGHRINCKAGNTKKEALTAQEELKTKHRLKMLHISDIKDKEGNFDIFFTVLSQQYFEHCKAVKGSKTYYNEKNYYDNHIKKAFEKLLLRSFNNKLLSDFQKLKKSDNYSNRTTNILVGIIRKIINHACDTDKRIKRLWNELDIKWPKSLRENKKQHAFLTFNEFDSLISQLNNKITRLRAIVMRYTGLRPAEAAYLQWPDVSLELRTVKVQGKKITDTLYWTPKDAEQRTIPLSDEAYGSLKNLNTDMLRRVKKTGLQERWVFSAGREPVFDMDKSLVGAATRAGIKKNVSPNMLRHTFATLQLASGA
ncbi:MAG TPA: hypothetical protein DHW81_03685, partial [Nitrospiraceae bacterium]|nr:hypothetical protein [Nitrospiraceae bacterium]